MCSDSVYFYLMIFLCADCQNEHKRNLLCRKSPRCPWIQHLNRLLEYFSAVCVVSLTLGAAYKACVMVEEVSWLVEFGKSDPGKGHFMSVWAWNWKSAKKKNTCNLSLHDQGWIYRTKCWVKMTAHLCSWSVCIARCTACAQCPVDEGWPALRVCKLCHPSEVLLHSNTGLTTSSCGGYRDS